MFDFLPWMDEVHIVEMGRLILSGGDADTILTNADGSAFTPLYYIGPCLQELLFRAFGPIGPRLSPLVGLLATAVFFHAWLRRAYRISRLTNWLLTLTVATAPLLVQSVRMVRVDTWVFACTFACLALLAEPPQDRPLSKPIAAGAITAISLFIWPTAFVLGPLYLTLGFFPFRQNLRQLGLYALAAAATGSILLLPVLPKVITMLSAFGTYFGSTGKPGFSFSSLAVPFVKEWLRAPLLMPLAAFGLAVWFRNRRFHLVVSFLLTLAVCVAANLHTFRFIYLMPYFLIMAVDGIAALGRKAPRTAHVLLLLTSAYGVLSGPVAYAVAPHDRLPPNIEGTLRTAVGEGVKHVFTPDYATYYIGRKLGWKQFAMGDPGVYAHPEILGRLYSRADAVILENLDPYKAIEESHTLYGFLRNRLLDAARREQESATPSPAARLGRPFAVRWHEELNSHEFKSVAKADWITVMRRPTPSPTPCRDNR